MLSSDGKVFPEAQYRDICYELNYVRVAINFDEGSIGIHNKTNEFFDFIRIPIDVKTGWSSICYEWEVMDAFYVRHNVIPIYSDMNYTWGWYDNETELWTGGVGAVYKSQNPKSQLSPNFLKCIFDYFKGC